MSRNKKVVATARSCNWVTDCISDDIQGKLGEVSTENDIKGHERKKRVSVRERMK